jgi:peptidoglycan/LPS O-acetylase OafA/YrhL
MSLRHRQNNFDITRLCLATFVFLAHYAWIFPNGPLPVGLIRFLIGDDGQRCVQAFFIISGFLMFQSFERSNDVLSFFEKRVRRIIPAYVTVIFLSAMLGLWLTHLSIQQYLSVDLIKYVLWNLIFLNFMHPFLPGVFDDLPIHYINGPLWTLKIEVAYYVLMPLLFRIGQRIGFISLFLTLYVLSVIYSSYMNELANQTGAHVYSILAAQLPGQMCYFASGALVASYRPDHLAFGDAKTFFCVALGGVALVSAGIFYLGVSILQPAILAAIVLSFCLAGPKLGGWMKYGDWSYGIYIIHFPVLQSMRSTNVLENHQNLLFLVASVSIFGLSFIIWNLIERPALKGRWMKRQAAQSRARTVAADL